MRRPISFLEQQVSLMNDYWKKSPGEGLRKRNNGSEGTRRGTVHRLLPLHHHRLPARRIGIIKSRAARVVISQEKSRSFW